MSSTISGDPLNRRTFAYEEGTWHDEMNANLTKTVDQTNDIQTVLLGDAQESTLDGYSESDIASRLSTAENNISSNDSDISLLQTEVDNRTKQSTFASALDQMAVGTVNSSGDPLTLQSGTNTALLDGDTLVIHAKEGTATSTATVVGDHDKGVTSIDVDADPSVNSGDLIFLSPHDLRESLNDEIVEQVLWGPNDPTTISTDHETRLGELQASINLLEDRVRSASYLAGESMDNLNKVENTLTGVQATAQEAALTAKELQLASYPYFELAQSYDEDQVDVLNVTGSDEVNNLPPDAPTDVELEVGDIIALQASDGMKYLSVGEDIDAPASAISTITLNQTYTITAEGAASVFEVQQSVAARVSARTNGNVVIRSKAAKSANFNGSSLVEKSDGTYRFARDSNDNPQIGDTGWALTSSGEIGATDTFLRGRIEMDESYLRGKLGLGPSASVVGQEPNSNAVPFHLSRYGLNIEANHTQSSLNSRAITFTDDNQTDADLGRLTATSSDETRRVTLRAMSDSSNAPARLVNTADNITIYAAGSGAIGSGEVALQGATAIRTQAILQFTKSLPEASGINDLIENQLLGNATVEYHFGLEDNPSATELASKLTGLKWIDTNNGRRLRVFHPSQYPEDGSTDPEPDPIIDPLFVVTTSLGSVYLTGSVITLIDESSVENGTITTREWDVDDGNGFSRTGESTEVSYSSAGEYTLRLRLTVQPDDDSASTVTQTTEQTIAVVEQEEDPPDLDPPNPIIA